MSRPLAANLRNGHLGVLLLCVEHEKSTERPGRHPTGAFLARSPRSFFIASLHIAGEPKLFVKPDGFAGVGLTSWTAVIWVNSLEPFTSANNFVYASSMAFRPFRCESSKASLANGLLHVVAVTAIKPQLTNGKDVECRPSNLPCWVFHCSRAQRPTNVQARRSVLRFRSQPLTRLKRIATGTRSSATAATERRVRQLPGQRLSWHLD